MTTEDKYKNESLHLAIDAATRLQTWLKQNPHRVQLGWLHTIDDIRHHMRQIRDGDWSDARR